MKQLINRLNKHFHDWAEGKTQDFEGVCADCSRAAEMLEQSIWCPYAPGDIVYEVDCPEYGIITCRILSVTVYHGPAGNVPGNEICHVVDMDCEVIDGHGKSSSYSFCDADFERLVFKKKSDAVKRLVELGGAI